MKQIYCDNASTSFPKAPGLGAAIGEHIDRNGYNISRGNYTKAYGVEEAVIEAKELLCEVFNFNRQQNVVFTPGATAGLNMIIKGLLKQGDHIITSSMEHNSVVRPIRQLTRDGVEWDEAIGSEKGDITPSAVEKRIKPNTKLILITHGSNVCGTVNPIEQIGEICQRHNLLFAIDSAQTAGSMEIDMDRNNIDALAFPGHKSLLGPQGVGGLLLSDRAAASMTPLIAGGTGSQSDKDEMPDFLPDKFQAGTLNLPGIIGLRHSLRYIREVGLMSIMEKKKQLTERFLSGVLNMEGINLIGKEPEKYSAKDLFQGRCPVVSLDFVTMDNAEASFILENKFGIMTRCGLHCAPHAHKTLKTFPKGTVRFSFGYFNEIEEVDYVIDAIHKVIKR